MNSISKYKPILKEQKKTFLVNTMVPSKNVKTVTIGIVQYY